MDWSTFWTGSCAEHDVGGDCISGRLSLELGNARDIAGVHGHGHWFEGLPWVERQGAGVRVEGASELIALLRPRELVRLAGG